MTVDELQNYKEKVEAGEELLLAIDKLKSHISYLELGVDFVDISYRDINGFNGFLTKRNMDFVDLDFPEELRKNLIIWLTDMRDEHVKKFENL